MSRVVAGGVMAGVLALGGAACGGSSAPAAGGASTSTTAGSSGASSGTSSSSASTFVSKGNAICKSGDQQANAAKQPADSAPLSEWATYLTSFLNVAHSVEGQLKGLTPPAAEQAQFSTYLSAFEASVSDAQNAQNAAANNDTNGFQAAVQSLAGREGTITSNARALGLTACASGNSNGSSTATSTATSGAGSP